jgi:hypothetical protein
MSDTVLERPRVREYLRALDVACAILPVAQAQELHELIAAHLDEVLPPSTSDAEVLAELIRLGTPRYLAATAVGPSRFPLLRKLGNRARRVRWWMWAAIAVLVPALGTGAGFLTSMKSAIPLNVLGTGWLYSVDQAHEVDTTADGVTQTTVPVRSGQRQGIEFGVWNNSDWTQLILGVGPRWALGSRPGETEVSVQSGPHLNQVGAPLSGTSYYASPGVIPPHSYRFVRVTWISDMCEQGNGESITDDIVLRVRVGVITRTEDLPLDGQVFALQGPSHDGCG